jgi:hypothetical protein
MLTWNVLQEEVAVWKMKNFPESPPKHQFWGLIEELGELVHAHLKKEQGIRGSAEKHVTDGKDAIADGFIFLMNVCTSYGWDVVSLLNHHTDRTPVKTPADLQRERGSLKVGYSPIMRILSHLSELGGCLEAAEFESLKKDAYLQDAKSFARGYAVSLAAYCAQQGWSLQDILEEVWPKVRARDWTKNKTTGVDLSLGQAQKDLEAAEDRALWEKLADEQANG